MKIWHLLKKTITTVKKNPKAIFSNHYINCFLKRLFSKTENENFYNPWDAFEYQEWLKVQKQSPFDITNFKYLPLISIILPVYNVKKEYLELCIQSVLNQKYQNFELCIVDDNSTNKETIECLKKYQNHPKIKIHWNHKNQNISSSSNQAIKMATGDFVALLDHDDMLDSDALSYVVKALNQDSKLDFIYTDEDKIDEQNERFDPFFKPDWAPDTLLSYNYICHFVIIRRTLLEKVGLFRTKYDGCQDYDLFLRITEYTQKIYHISKILYHWRTLDTSTAKNIHNKDKIVEKTQKMLKETLDRRNKNAIIEILPENNYYIKYQLEKKYKISIIIPTRDHSELLEKCVSSILAKTNYENYEIIIVNNNSCEKETFDLFTRYQKNEKIKIININCEFNYSYLNNQAVKQAVGEYIVLLNNDTEVISEDWLEQMLSFASQSHIGTVGAKLLYQDDTIQHGGVIIGVGGVAGHAFIGEKKNYSGPYSILKVPRNVGANTAACFMIEKKKYELVKGLDENIKVAFNDVDFNLKLLKKGYYNLFLPNIMLYHYESKSRGLEDTEEKRKRFNEEVQYMKQKWGNTLNRDPFYNDNLSYLYNYKIDIK